MFVYYTNSSLANLGFNTLMIYADFDVTNLRQCHQLKAIFKLLYSNSRNYISDLKFHRVDTQMQSKSYTNRGCFGTNTQLFFIRIFVNECAKQKWNNFGIFFPPPLLLLLLNVSSFFDIFLVYIFEMSRYLSRFHFACHLLSKSSG